MLHPDHTITSFLRTAAAVIIIAVAAAASIAGDQDDARSFAKCREYKSPVDLASTPVSDGAALFFLETSNTLTAIEVESSAKRWTSDLGGEVVSNLLPSDAGIFVVTSTRSGSNDAGKSYLRSLSKQTGVTTWSTEIPYDTRVFLGMVNGSLVVVGSAGVVTAVAPADGSQIWRTSIGAKVVSEPYFADGVLVATAEKRLVKISAGGAVRTFAKTDRLATALLLEPSGRTLFGDERGNLVSLTPQGKKVWRLKNGGRVSFVFNYDSEFVTTSDDNFIYKLSRGGNVEWKRRLSGRVANRPILIDGLAVVSIIGDPSVYVIGLSDGKLANRIEVPDGTSALAVGATASGFAIFGGGVVSLYTLGQCPSK